ncbi:MAG: VOC family protein [Polyangiaceae bacterium]
MKLNHLDLQVPDVQHTTLFFERHFGFRLTTSRTSPAIAILDGPGEFTLVLQRKKDPAESYPTDFHIGFIVDDEVAVERAHAELSAAGEEVSPVTRNGRGTMIYCRRDGFLVEVSRRARHG